jgi:hypothetical protein
MRRPSGAALSHAAARLRVSRTIRSSRCHASAFDRAKCLAFSSSVSAARPRCLAAITGSATASASSSLPPTRAIKRAALARMRFSSATCRSAAATASPADFWNTSRSSSNARTSPTESSLVRPATTTSLIFASSSSASTCHASTARPRPGWHRRSGSVRVARDGRRGAGRRRGGSPAQRTSCRRERLPRQGRHAGPREVWRQDSRPVPRRGWRRG